MAWRVTRSDVLSVLPEEVDRTNLDAYIEAANSIVNSVCVPPNIYDATTLAIIEKWLAAHCAAAGTRGAHSPVVRERVDVSEVEYNRWAVQTFGPGLKSTPFGQTAMRVEYGGYLSRLDNWMDKATRRHQRKIVHLG